jgi:hypothetical protein
MNTKLKLLNYNANIYFNKTDPSWAWHMAVYRCNKTEGLICFLFVGVGWDWVHLVRGPLFGLLYQFRMIDDECGAVG